MGQFTFIHAMVTRKRWKPPILGLIALIMACGSADDPRTTASSSHGISARLRTGAGTLCDPHYAMILEARDGEALYRFNSEPLDSTELVSWLRHRVEIARRPPNARIVMLRVDSSRFDELPFLVHTVEEAGGVAYEPDAACYPPPVPAHLGTVNSRVDG